jgi:hypothetical protein
MDDLIDRTTRFINEMTDEDVSPEDLNEFRIIRGASALVFAAKSKQAGNKVVQHARRGQGHLDKLKRQESSEDKVDVLADALDEVFNSLIQNRIQMGNLVSIAVASVLISERSDKSLTKMMKQRR